MSTQTLRIEIPKNEWLTSNDRHHPQARNARIKAIRARSALLARERLTPVHGPVLVTAQAIYRAGRGLDDDNCQPTVKAIKDGLTDAGIWEDDAGQFITGGTHYLPSARDKSLGVGWHAIRLIITPQEVTS